jgi:hypothetical protein
VFGAQRFGFKLGTPEAERAAKAIQEVDPLVRSRAHTHARALLATSFAPLPQAPDFWKDEIVQHVQTLWEKNAAIMEAFNNRSKLQLPDSAQYLFQNIERIGRPGARERWRRPFPPCVRRPPALTSAGAQTTRQTRTTSCARACGHRASSSACSRSTASTLSSSTSAASAMSGEGAPLRAQSQLPRRGADARTQTQVDSLLRLGHGRDLRGRH